MDDVRLVEEKASAKQDCHWKADEKLAQANSKITELEAKLAGLQRELNVTVVLDKQLYHNTHSCHIRTPLILYILLKFFCELWEPW